MKKLTAPLLICLLAATAVAAQPGGAGGRRGGSGHGGAGDAPVGVRPPATKPFKPPEIIGVVKGLDAATGRITISYDAIEALGWPPGTQPFPVAKTALMTGVSVGEKVRFSLESGQISAIRPFETP